ncbi:MAG: hypothetical protein U0132_00700 [Gemmatimonadaceae bacterium]
MTTPSLLDPVRGVFRAVATTVVPECHALNDNEWAELEGIVEAGLASRPAALQRQLVTFLRAIELLPVFRYAVRFQRLDATRRERVLTGLQNSRVFTLRRGMWGLRTLVFMGYYARPAAASAIGYRASPAGWAARRLPNDSSPTPA